MKKIFLIFGFFFSTLIFSSSSYGSWTKVSEGTGQENRGTISYVNYESIRKVDEYSYFWSLTDYLKPSINGELSAQFYSQGDCQIFRYKILTISFHKMPMGNGKGRVVNISKYPKYDVWNYPKKGSMHHTILRSICSK